MAPPRCIAPRSCWSERESRLEMALCRLSAPDKVFGGCDDGPAGTAAAMGRPYCDVAYEVGFGKAGSGAGARWVVLARRINSMQTGSSRFSYSVQDIRCHLVKQAWKIAIARLTLKLDVIGPCATIEQGNPISLHCLRHAVELHHSKNAFHNLSTKYGGLVQTRTEHQDIATHAARLESLLNVGQEIARCVSHSLNHDLNYGRLTDPDHLWQ